MMVRIATYFTLALTIASTAFAAHLANGVYRIIYTPPQSGDRDSPPHYLTLASPKMDATFSPILMRGVEEKAQWWNVTTSETNRDWRYIESVGHAGVSLSYPSMDPGTRVRGAGIESNDYTQYVLIDTGTDGDYFVFPWASWDVVLNGDVEAGPKSRDAYFRDNFPESPDVVALRFEEVDVSRYEPAVWNQQEL